MTEKLKMEVYYDEGLTTYELHDTTVPNDCFNCLLNIDVHDGNFKYGSEDKYHEKVKKFINELIENGEGWND